LTMAVSDIETQDLLKSIDAKLDSIATIMAKNANVAENGKSSEMEQELIRTRKALDVAVDALKDNLSQANFTQMLDASRFHCIRTKCELALEQITALKRTELENLEMLVNNVFK